MVIAGLAATDATAATTLTKPQIAAKVDPGLVDVVTTLGYQGGKAAGTGMVLTSTGEVLTNNHVIDGATSIKATDVGNGRTYTAKVVGYDKTHDVAVLQLQNASGLQTVTLSSTGPQAGQKVVALGNALGKGGTPSVVSGRITGLGQSITASDEGAGNAEQLTGMIGHNAPIQPGDSGGPLANTEGEVIGMNTAGSSSSSGSPSPSGQAQAATQAFAIPITRASSIASQIEAGTPSSTVHIGATAFLGVETSPSGAGGFGGNFPGSGGNGGFPGNIPGFGGNGGNIPGFGGNFPGFGGDGGNMPGFGGNFPGFGGDIGGYIGGSGSANGGGSANGSGVAISGVVSGSAAARAGLAAGDQITSVAGHTVTSSSEIQSVLGNYHPGDKISISWTDQSGQSHTATATLSAGPAH
jgi:S1-C subfamily serine protease